MRLSYFISHENEPTTLSLDIMFSYLFSTHLTVKVTCSDGSFNRVPLVTCHMAINSSLVYKSVYGTLRNTVLIQAQSLFFFLVCILLVG